MKVRGSTLRSGVLFFGVVLASACFNGKDTQHYPCLDNDQCGKDLLCERGFCGGPPIMTDPATGLPSSVNWGPCLIEGCASGEVCASLGEAFLSCGPPCTSSSECVGYIWDPWVFGCANGACVPLCNAENRCPDGRDCVNVGGLFACGWMQSSM